jgi:hypothetical protein
MDTYARKFLDVKGLAEYLGVPIGWVYDRTRRNGPEEIPQIRFGKYIRFDIGSERFREWLAKHETAFELTRQQGANKLSPETEDEPKIGGKNGSSR